MTFILLTIFIDILGYSMILPLLPLFVQNQGGGAALAGGLSALYAALQLFSGPVLGSLSDRYGRKPILLLCLFGTAIAYILFGFANALWVLYLAVILDGLTGNNLATAHAYIADITTEEKRAHGMSLAGAAFGFGLIVGPIIGGLLSDYGLYLPAFVAAGLALANTLYGAWVLPESLAPEKRSYHPVSFNAFAHLKTLLAQPAIRSLLLAVFALNLAFSGLLSNFPLFSDARFGWDARQNSLFFAFVGLIAVLVQGILYGRIQPRVGEKRLSIIGLALMAVGMAGIAYTPVAWAVYPCTAIAALGSGSSIPSLSGLISARTSPAQQGLLMGGTQTLLGLTSVIGPALAGLAFQHIAIPAPYWIGSGFAALALLITATDFSRQT